MSTAFPWDRSFYSLGSDDLGFGEMKWAQLQGRAGPSDFIWEFGLYPESDGEPVKLFCFFN